MSNEWDEYADGWDDDPAARAYAAAAFESLLALLDAVEIPLAGARALDFGCGTGLLSERLAAQGASVVAVDTSPAMLAVLDAKIDGDDDGSRRIETASRIPDAPAVFDLIVCSSVCGFLDDYPATAADLATRLRPGGLFVQWDWERVEPTGHGLSPTEIREALEQADLIDVDVTIGFTIGAGDEVMAPLMGRGRRVDDPNG